MLPRCCALLLALVVAGCTTSSNPDQGHYACSTAADCGSGWECWPQFKGGGLCFKAGVCTAVEQCNGTDDNCDGRVDERFPTQGVACQTGKLGVCAAGTNACASGAIVCAQTTAASAELCNGLDDDCNGQVDETFDLTTDSMHCGACAHACDAGTTCADSVCHETLCGDGVDNDQNGLADCADPFCFNSTCDGLTPASRCGALDGGLDAGHPDAGASDGGRFDCYRPEAACDNGLDDDHDGLVDCADPDCDGRTCSTGAQCAQRTCPGAG
jgi:hypothetical protein